MQLKILLVTYTMKYPAAVVGVFFRALRLAFEFHKRGWSTVICNRGPIPKDPKMDQAREVVHLISLEPESPLYSFNGIRQQLASYGADIVIFGEGPFPDMEVFYKAAKSLNTPFILLDQYYQDRLLTRRHDVDLLLLYGLEPFWRGEFNYDKRYRLVPPFIQDITPRDELPVPRELHDQPWVTIVGFDDRVLQGGIEVVAGLTDRAPVVICLSHEPETARDLLHAAQIESDRSVTYPIQEDRHLFALISNSQVVVLANGFMQIMEAVALGTPAICIDRGCGFEAWTLADRFKPYLSVGETREIQRQRLRDWLDASPFTPDLVEALLGERDGARVCADAITEIWMQKFEAQYGFQGVDKSPSL